MAEDLARVPRKHGLGGAVGVLRVSESLLHCDGGVDANQPTAGSGAASRLSKALVCPGGLLYPLHRHIKMTTAR
jgi:hypothetical protein